MSTLNANISALGTWILDRTEQPLELDWIELVPEGGQETSVQASLPQAFLHGAKRLISSYTDDYNQLGAEGEGNGSVDVWLASGRDQRRLFSGCAIISLRRRAVSESTSSWYRPAP